MPAPRGSPAWAAELAASFESGAANQFLLVGNVRDRQVLPDGTLGDLDDLLLAALLASFQVVFTYDVGNGLLVARGAEVLNRWGGAAALEALPGGPLAAIRFVSSYLRYLGNLRSLGRDDHLQVACLLRDAHLVVPAGPTWNPETAALASLLRDWSTESPFHDLPFTSLLIADNRSDLHPLLAQNPRAVTINVPMPEVATLGTALARLRQDHPAAFAPEADPAALARGLVGVTTAALESLVKHRQYERKPIVEADLAAAKKALVEAEAGNLITFLSSRRTLDDYQGQSALKEHLRQDAVLWRAGDTAALPMGYLICGPVGTGKTFLVECLAGEVGVPVVKLGNFRDRWVGSSEGNLERIFRLIHALGSCIVFVDEADQSLGRREAGGNDGGLSGRLYGMIAQEMGDGANRGRLLWILASSRPDLIEVDLKRPGRIDVKIPLLPTTTVEESAGLLASLCQRRRVPVEVQALAGLPLPILLTPGAAEAIAVKSYRLAKTRGLPALEAVRACLEGYQPPVAPAVLEHQMRLAVREATDLAFVPGSLRHLAHSTD